MLGTAFTIGPSATGAATVARGLPATSSQLTETVLHTFGSAGDGAHPFAGLVADGSGNLFGTTEAGGSLGHGTVFMLIKTATGYTEAVLHNFGTSPNASDGANPVSGLLLDTHENLYGTTKYGGSGSGVVFKLSPGKTGWTETVLHTLNGTSDGANPVAGLAADGSGNLYGTTQAGGTAGRGVAFMLLPVSSGWTEGILHNFGTATNAADGATPVAGLLLDTKGNAYGTTEVGGAGYGLVFKLSPGKAGWTETVLHTFSGASDGANPQAGLIADPSGNLFGTTFGGGAGYGLVFELSSSSNWSEIVLHDFATSPNASDGANPAAGLVGSFDACVQFLAGTTEGGGNGYGTAFELEPSASGNWPLNVLHTFATAAGSRDGANPVAGLSEDSTGNFYGTTQGGGTGSGVVFKLGGDPAATQSRVRPNGKKC